MIDLSHVRFYGILDSGYVPPESWIEKYDALASGGAGLIQIRAKRESPSQRARLVAQIVNHREKSVDSAHPPLVVNDDLELALAFSGLGLHVGQDDIPATDARARLGPDRILGLSTHSPSQADAAIELGPDVLSYFAVGPVFSTQTKPDYIPVGLELVRYVADKASPIPFFCIGGINRQNIPHVAEAGAKRIVTVSDVLCDADTAAAVRQSLQLLTA